MIRSGHATLPLHYGKVPPWLYERMGKIGLAATELIITEYGTEGLVSRMSDPCWFQSLGCVMGMDWHSSGITTSVLGALKQVINPLSSTLGLYLCGGRGLHSRKTPQELEHIGSTFGIPSHPLITASRLSAKVDNSCIDDGYQLYLHCFLVDRSGHWTVIQQGMNQQDRSARRYHWHSRGISSFVEEPQSAIVGENRGTIMNLTDRRAEGSRNAVVDFLSQHPDRQRKELEALDLIQKAPATQYELFMPSRHEVRQEDVNSSRLGAVLALAYERGVEDFESALLVPGVGPRTLQSLSLVSEIVYGKPTRFSDPARFSFAHGGKDGHPFPVPLKTYDESISLLEKAAVDARIGRQEKAQALRRLHTLALEIERDHRPRADVEALIAHEREISDSLGGKTVYC